LNDDVLSDDLELQEDFLCEDGNSQELYSALPERLWRINTVTISTFIDSPASNKVLWRRPRP